MKIRFLSQSSAETLYLGERISGALRADDVAGLTGDLGSGKTCLIQGICRGLGVTEPVTSPTFTLVQEYTGSLPVYHLDLYRLDRIEEIEQLGLDQYFESGGIALIEWAERARPILPAGAIDIRIDRDAASEDARRITVTLPEGRDPIVAGDFVKTIPLRDACR